MTSPIGSMQDKSTLVLDGGINFRDFGGLPAADGRHIRFGRLFRSGDLHRLTARDCDTLAALPLNSILDYRDKDESQLKPDRLWTGVEYHSIPANPQGVLVNGNLEKLIADMLSDIDAKTWMCEFYRRLPFANPAYKKLVSLLLSQPEGAIVQHCTFGKDRTGVGSALILFALGADEETVMADYLRSQKTLADYRESVLTEYAPRISQSALQQLSALLVANPDFLQAAIEEIVHRYGSVNTWLKEDYQLDKDRLTQLREHYLE